MATADDLEEIGNLINELGSSQLAETEVEVSFLTVKLVFVLI